MCLVLGLCLIVWSAWTHNVVIYFIVIAIGPLFVLINWATSSVKGTCPSCGAKVSEVPEDGRINCSICHERSVVRDGRLWWEPKSSSEDVISLPPGMNQEELSKFKDKLRKQFRFRCILTTIFVFILFGYLGLNDGAFIDLKVQKLDELQKMEGVFFYNPGGGRIKVSSIGLKDSNNQTILYVHQGLGKAPWPKYHGMYATMWYSDGPGDSKYLYQIAVNARLVLSLEEANLEVENLNSRKRTADLVIFVAIPLLLIIFDGLLRKYSYRKKVANLYGQTN